MISTDCIGSCKSNCHMLTTMVPRFNLKWILKNLILYTNLTKLFNNSMLLHNVIVNKQQKLFNYSWLIDWCLTPTLAIFQLYGGVFNYSIAVNRKRANNAMTKWKRTETNNDLQNTTHKTKDWATRTPQKNQGWTRVLLKGKQFLPH